MAQSFTIIRDVGTTLTRSSTQAEMNALAAEVLALFHPGGSADQGMDKAYVQWRAMGTTTTFEIVIEDEVLSGLSADLSARASAIRTALLTLPAITAIDVADIATLEQSSPAHV